MRAEHIDATLFLGMHAFDESIRRACKNFFVERLADSTVVMSFEQVGRCDALVWRYGRAEQDDYYPFMDVLHTDMDIQRRPYGLRDVEAAQAANLTGLDLIERLTVGMVLADGGELVTISPRLLDLADAPTRAPSVGEELAFPKPLEELYQRSLALRVQGEDLLTCTRERSFH
ncbi:DUF6190 family protein [Actinoalloteichus hymeniacidonis]|uniref:Uncharacterized protein n=1 Tax=Actinoalloteichus hymeniacidonis TaxID=340345 RepID=A0AAC9HSM9_9PSEU|nr:DUF6190 family protein [Actinoalloteichus hymeniacidonis]AOS64614.1 hypothetical protein TL08_19115 [Actinoalloteichus hymeniacidonis]MBB5907313.1 hypothetical protein [Actinoalloteichus hymeniacidonis]